MKMKKYGLILSLVLLSANVNAQDNKTQEQYLNELKKFNTTSMVNKNFNQMVKSLCNYDEYVLIKEELNSYCRNILLDIENFKIFELAMNNHSFNDDKFNLEDVKINTLDGYKNVSYLFLTRVLKNPKAEIYVENIKDENKAISNEEIIKNVNDIYFNTEISENEFNNIKASYEDLKNKLNNVNNINFIMLNNIKKKYLDKKNPVMTPSLLEEIFLTEANTKFIQSNISQLDQVLKNRIIYQGTLRYMNTGKINELINEMSKDKSKKFEVSKDECEFIKETEMFNKEGMKNLICK